MPWQRLLSLQVLRWLMLDPLLLYALFTSYDMSIHHDVNAVHDTLHVALEIVKVGADTCCSVQSHPENHMSCCQYQHMASLSTQQRP